MNNQDFVNAQSIWGVPHGTVMTHIEKLTDTYRMKHGMFASVPIICRVDKCPYFNVCTVDPQYRLINTRCPMEIAAIIARYDYWCEHFNIDTKKATVSKEDAADASLIRDLVDNEVQMIRAENKIAMSGDFIERTIAQIDNKGKAYYEDTVGPASEFKMALQDKRYKILQLLNSTRKDKANQMAKLESYSAKAQSLMDKVKEAKIGDLDSITDADVEHLANQVQKEGEQNANGK